MILRLIFYRYLISECLWYFLVGLGLTTYHVDSRDWE